MNIERLATGETYAYQRLDGSWSLVRFIGVIKADGNRKGVYGFVFDGYGSDDLRLYGDTVENRVHEKEFYEFERFGQ